MCFRTPKNLRSTKKPPIYYCDDQPRSLKMPNQGSGGFSQHGADTTILNRENGHTSTSLREESMQKDQRQFNRKEESGGGDQRANDTYVAIASSSQSGQSHHSVQGGQSYCSPQRSSKTTTVIRVIAHREGAARDNSQKRRPIN